MSYSQFTTIAKVKRAFGLSTVEGQRLLPEMVAAQRFKLAQENPVDIIYGVVTNGILWRFLTLEGTVVSIDSIDYSLPPVDPILGILVWMLRH